MNKKLVLLAFAACLSDGHKHAKKIDASTVLFARFVPEREDDFAWENDLVAFRAYGPALKGVVDAGTDCWLKRVKYPIVNKWYREHTQENKSYHIDHGEGLDNYHVGKSAGCGSTSLWLNDQRESLGTYTSYSDVKITNDYLRFTLKFERTIDNIVYTEKKEVSLVPGSRLFKVVSTFYKDGVIAALLPISIGVTTHDGIADVYFNENKKWLSTWRTLDDSELGTGIFVDTAQTIKPVEIPHTGTTDQAHALYVTQTDSNGQVTYYAGYGWKKANEITTHEQWQQYLNAFATFEG